MNKKTILLLINGFGVEKKESYSIYDQSLMPTFDSLTKTALFQTIESKVNNYFDGYRNMSLDINELYNYSLLNEDIDNKTFVNNQILINLKNDFYNRNGTLHFFCLVDTSLKIADHLKETLKFLNSNRDKKIVLHFIISSTNILDYKKLTEVFSKINIEISDYATIGFILGLSSIDNNAKQVDVNFFFKMFITKVGEKWQSFTQKFDVLYGTKVIPRDTKPFIVNTKFSLEPNDTFFFFNYDTLNLTNFINTLSNIRFGEKTNSFAYYSLFPLTSNKQIPHLYEARSPKVSLVNDLNTINAKCLVLCKKEQVGVINYFANGLKNEISPNLSFVDILPYQDNPDMIKDIVNKFNQDLIIIDYEIDEFTKTSDLKNKLQTIDKVVEKLLQNMDGSKYSLVISSLFGMSKTMLNEKNHICQVIFSGQVPFIFVDDFITKKDYLIAPGSINDILKSCYKNIDRTSKFDSIVEKRNILHRLFFK